MSKEQIELKDIKSEEVRDNITQCSEAIARFIKVINNHLPQEMKIDESKLYFRILSEKDDWGFENDGNTRCEQYKYKVRWAFDLTGKIIDEYADWYFNEGRYQNALYFTYEQSERIHDNKADRSRFFTLYLSSTETRVNTDVVKRIDYNNDNYKLTSIINTLNAAECIKGIKKNIEFYNLLQSLNGKL